MKKVLSFLLVVLMFGVMTACGGNDRNLKAESLNGYVVRGHKASENAKVEFVQNDIDPKEIYDNLTYTPEMFYGSYKIGDKEAETKYSEESQYMVYNDGEKDMLLTSIPFKIEAGHNTWLHKINYIEDHNWLCAYYYQKSEEGAKSYLTYIYCAYTVDGKTLTLKPIKNLNVDTENNKITYEFSDYVWEYEFSFRGRALTLAKDGKSVTINAGLDPYGEELYLFAEGYLSPDSKAADGIDQFEIIYESPSDNRLFVESISGEGNWTSVAKLEENGRMTLTVPWESGTKTYQYVYFLCYNDGLILADKDNVYYYNDSYTDRKKLDVNKYLSEDQTGKLDSLTENQLDAIIEKKENLMEDLAKAFTDAGITVTVDSKTGELAMDSSVLFGGDSAELTADGKAFLNKFVNVYTTTVFSEKYTGFVQKTMVEGHTAPLSTSTYESGLPLSKKRAENVKNYCVSSETGVDTSKLAAALESVGYSNSKPIYNTDGSVNMTASRRVSFRFIINLDI